MSVVVERADGWSQFGAHTCTQPHGVPSFGVEQLRKPAREPWDQSVLLGLRWRPASRPYRFTGDVSLGALLLSQATPSRSGSSLFGSRGSARRTAWAWAWLEKALQLKASPLPRKLDGSNDSAEAATGVALAVGAAFAVGVGAGASGDLTVGVGTAASAALTVGVARSVGGDGFPAGTGASSGAGGGASPWPAVPSILVPATACAPAVSA